MSDTPTPAWKWNGFMGCWEHGSMRVYPVQRQEFVIAKDDQWLPGTFTDLDKAKEAVTNA